MILRQLGSWPPSAFIIFLFFFTSLAHGSQEFYSLDCAKPLEYSHVKDAVTSILDKNYEDVNSRSVNKLYELLVVGGCVTAQNISMSLQEFSQFKNKILELKTMNLLNSISPYYQNVSALKELERIEKLAPHLLPAETKKSIAERLRVSTKLSSSVDRFLEKQSCETAEVDTSALGPVREQGSTAWCFGVVAADLISFKKRKYVSGVRLTTDFYTATIGGVYSDEDRGLANGGALSRAIEIGLQNGTCGYGSTYEAQAIDRMHQKNFGVFQKLNRTLDKYHRRYFEKPQSCVKAPSTIHYIIDSFYHSLIAQRKKVIRELERGVPTCTRTPANFEIKDSSQKIRTKTVDFSIEQLKIIDDQLNQKNMVAAGFDGSMIRERNTVADGNRHAGSIIKRRFNEKTNACEYLVRTTWGDDYINPNFESENGNLWVTRRELLANIYKVVYLK